MLPTCVATVPIFAGLDASAQQAIDASLRRRVVAAGDVVTMPGDGAGLTVVHEGRLRQSRLSETGSEQLLRVLGPGDFTGEAELLGAPHQPTVVTAMIDSHVCSLSAEDMREVLREQPSVALHMLASVSERLTAAEEQLTRITGRSVGARLGEYLAGLAVAVPEGTEFDLPMPKKDLASFLGTTPETISRQLRSMEDQGLIAQAPRGRVTVLDAAALALLD